MSFEAPPIRPQRVAIIGGGIPEQAAAHRLGGYPGTVVAGMVSQNGLPMWYKLNWLTHEY